jgi:hypothetical protein
MTTGVVAIQSRAVLAILSLCRWAKVVDAVVCPVAINVVNLNKAPFTVVMRPCKPVGVMELTIYSDRPVSMPDASSNLSGWVVAHLDSPSNDAGLRVVVDHFA